MSNLRSPTDVLFLGWSSLGYSRLPWALMIGSWLTFATLIAGSAIDEKLHHHLAVLCMLVFLGTINHSDRLEDKEKRWVLLSRLPVSRRDLAKARVAAAISVVVVGFAAAIALLALSRLLGYQLAFYHVDRIPFAALAALCLRLMQILFEEVADRLSPGVRLPFAVLSVLGILTLVVLWLVPIAFPKPGSEALPPEPWMYLLLGGSALLAGLLGIEGFVRRSDLSRSSVFHQLDRSFSGRNQ